MRKNGREEDFKNLRDDMVDEQIIKRGIVDVRVISALRRVPRHKFVPQNQIDSAYEDMPIPAGEGQTISQPFIVALMTQSLKLQGDELILEIGTGTGYQTAILSELCREVYSIERISKLAQQAQEILDELNYRNVKIHVGDGTLGWPERILFDAIMVTAASPNRLEHLLKQLNEKGRMVIPIGNQFGQKLTLIEKKNTEVKAQEICPCVFVPLIGEFGWKGRAF